MGFFDIFNRGLSKTRKKLSMDVDRVSNKQLGAETLEELEELLVMSDISVETAGKICSSLALKMKSKREDLPLREQLRDTLAELLLPDEEIDLSSKPTIITVVGVNGVGKTTTIGKLAHSLSQEGKTVLLAAADTFRAAAAEQLAVWAERCGCRLVRHEQGADPASVVYDAIQSGKARGVDVIICDTAGRLHNKKHLMDELAKINKIIDREAEGLSKECLLVIDATTGQNGLSQAKLFAESAGVTGMVVTKLDGTAKGGVVVSIKEAMGLPIKYVGLGEKIGDLQKFSAHDFATAILMDTDDNTAEEYGE